MYKKKYLFIGLVFGMVIGWILGFLRVPYVEKNASFGLGFMAALTIVSLVLMLLTASNMDFPLRLIGKKTENGHFKTSGRHIFVWILVIGAPILGGVLSGLTFYGHNQLLKRQIQRQDKQMQEVTAVIQGANKNNWIPLIRTILEDVGEELKHSPDRTLRDTTVARIAALSSAFKPYQYFGQDSLWDNAYSPERGQLLQALVLMHINSTTFAQIKRSASFAGADLQQTDLKGLDLSGINLKAANLKNADWSGANLKGADLEEANLWGANLNKANLENANLKRTDLGWAHLNETTLASANLNGANLANAQLRKADLKDASLEWAQSGGALFNEANLTSVHLTGTNLTKANLSWANLSWTDLRKVNLSEAVLVGVQLNNVLVDENWQASIMEWEPLGVKELQKNYTVVNDTFDKGKRALFRLKKNER